MLINIYTKTSPSSRLALKIALACIVAIGTYDWLVIPHITCLEAAEKYAGQFDSFAKKSQTIESLAKIKKIEADKLAQQVGEIHKQLFTTTTAQQFFSTLEPYAKQTGCAITSLKLLTEETAVQDTNTPQQIKPCQISLALKGSFGSVTKFLTELKTREELITINPFLVSVRQDEKLECSLILTIYIVSGEGVTSYGLQN